jgi:hypothetical protein
MNKARRAIIFTETEKRECKHKEVTEKDLNLLLSNALKKWADGRQETRAKEEKGDV